MTPGPITSLCFPKAASHGDCEIKIFTKDQPADREVYPVKRDVREHTFDQEVTRLMLLKQRDPDFKAVVVQLRTEWGGLEKTTTIGDMHEHHDACAQENV